jgi:hypothetical protein
VAIHGLALANDLAADFPAVALFQKKFKRATAHSTPDYDGRERQEDITW